MVWFQCDDCGENLKKPKLANHFYRCSASRLSCIDCGKEFNQQSVQQHTQCVTEVQKYGPKGAGKNGVSGGGETTFGLSVHPPWSCSLCNVKATSRETIEIHGQSKRHKSKARAAIKAQNPAKEEEGTKDVVAEEVKQPANKRKREEDGKEQPQEEQPVVNTTAKVIRWRKLISTELKKASDGVLRKKKLVKALMPAAAKAAENAGLDSDTDSLKSQLDAYLSSTSKFVVDGKRIRIAAKTSE